MTMKSNYNLPDNVAQPWLNTQHDAITDIRDNMRRFREAYYERNRVNKVIAVVSGGLDSTTMVYHLLRNGAPDSVDLVSFDYGQRHKKELIYAKATANRLGLRHDIVDLTDLTHLISNSALTSGEEHVVNEHPEHSDWKQTATYHPIEVPDGHYAEENMKATVVPNRNMIMLSIAAGIAVNRGASSIATAVHAGDHFIYPDCRPEFIQAAAQAIVVGNEGFHKFQDDSHLGNAYINVEAIYAPFIEWSKEDIAYHALRLGVPIHMTWSCYKGNDKHCGRCGTCVERLEAIDGAIRRTISDADQYSASYVEDMTEYADNEYWRQAVREKK